MNKTILFILLISFSRCFWGMGQSNVSVTNNIRMIENFNFEGWPNCIKLSNGKIELIVTTDVGPRIIYFGFINGLNFFYVSSADKGKTGGDKWHLFGGHRFWLAPEIMPRTYAADNTNVKYTWNGKVLKLSQDIEPQTNTVKEIEITMYPNTNEVEVLHRIINQGKSDVELAPWAITACAPGGLALIPQEPYIDPADYLLPIRPLVLWAYTKMNDPRYVWGEKFIVAKQDPTISSETKIGVLNKQKWAAYYINDCLFLKIFEYEPNSVYPDFGCNNEIYINGDFIEVETLGPLSIIHPNESVEHLEKWILVQKKLKLNDEDALELAIKQMLKFVSNWIFK